MKELADTRLGAQESGLEVGDQVLIRQEKRDKMDLPFVPSPYKVESKKGSMVTARRGDHSVTRNTSFFKRITPNCGNKTVVESQDCEIQDPDVPVSDHEDEGVAVRISDRIKSAPSYLNDFVLT